MKKLYLSFAFVVLGIVAGYCQLTLEYCLQRADVNYPVLRKYGIVEQTELVALSDISKGWLPSVSPYAQITAQNAVPKFPEALRGVMSQAGHNIKGLSPFQYKLGVDVSQRIWDGGSDKVEKELAGLQSDVAKAEIETQLYAMHEKVINLFFGILLVEEQIEQVENSIDLLEANRRKLAAMVKNGVAMQSDVDMVSAQILTLKQNIIAARNSIKSYYDLLGIYMDEDITGRPLVRPDMMLPITDRVNRPELKTFETRQALTNAKYKSIDVSLKPKVGLFAQAYYGYPGLDYFQSMMKRTPSFNILAGVKVSWNISPLYTKDNSKKKLELAALSTEVDKEIFLFNTSLQTKAQRDEIKGLRDVAMDDGEIIRLREKVRKVAESQLNNGVIDITGLLTKITEENHARLTARLHEVELLYAVYKLKYILNQ